MAGEASAAGETGPLFEAALAAARDPRRMADELPGLLERLEARRDALDGYERAVLWHLHGIEAWRLLRDVPRATHAFQRSITLLHALDEDRAPSYAGRVFDTLGQMLHHEGLLADARREFERALALKEATSDAEGLALTQGNLGRLLMELGDFEAAGEHLERDLAYVDATMPDDARLRGQLLTQIGMCRLETEDLEAARRVLEESEALATRRDDAVGLAFATAYLGRLALAKGDLEAAAGRASDTRGQIARIEGAVRGELEALVLQLEAEVERRRGHLEAALDRYAKAGDAFESGRRASPVEQAKFLCQWADAWAEEGRTREATDLLRRALRRLDATTAEQIRATLDARLRSIDENAWMLHSTGRFVGHGQIELLLSEAGQAGFRGKAEDVTVLFSDLRGFTSVSEGLDPEVLVDVLNRYLGAMTRCVEHFGGMIDKFIGDAVMALFTLPTPRGDDADRAVAAALYMQTELERFNRTLPEHLQALSAGIGLHAGRVTAGLIGSPQRRSYTVVGDTVNTASRLEGMTKQMGAPILITREVVDRLVDPDRWLLLPLGSYRPKGRQGAIEIFGVLGVRDGSSLTADASRLIEATNEALDHFAARRFAEAKDAFDALARTQVGAVGAPAYARLAVEADRLRREPPPESWIPSVVLTEK